MHKILTNQSCVPIREEYEVFDNKMQQDAQEMLRYFLTSLHEILLGTLSSLPPPSAETTPTETMSTGPVATGQEERGGVDAIDVDAVSKLATRKRKISQQKLVGRKISKILKRKSAKVTDYFQSTSASFDDDALKHSKGVATSAKKESKPQLTANDNLDFVKHTFRGELVSQIRCYECDGFTRRTEPFLDVSLAVSSSGLPGFPVDSTPTKTHNPPHRMLAREMSFVGPFSLSWVLSQFCLRERLRGDNKYHCERCGHLVEAERSVMFGRLPLVMTLHLNRFATHSMEWMASGGLAVNKVGGNLAVPLTLRFSTWCTKDCPRKDQLYHLIAVVFHSGSSCTTGHYTACVRGKECRVIGSSPTVTEWIGTGTNWVEFDDEVVTLITQERLLDMLSPLTPSTAYILFYSMEY